MTRRVGRFGPAARSAGDRLASATCSALLALIVAGLAGCGADEAQVAATTKTDMSVAEYEAALAHTGAASGVTNEPRAERHTDKTPARIERGQITLIEALQPKTNDRTSRAETRAAAGGSTGRSSRASEPASGSASVPTRAVGADTTLAPWAQRATQESSAGYRVVVRLEDGQTREFVEPVVDGLTVGDFVQVVRTSVAPT